ncbi:hypothetical protein KUTeg_009901 [Tegillarca granosa]|uniref:Uncharacterized protein n=1 Tax=Tegillarca granosa TaxID=220873 RepID=A0ABQ9F568_TEGGR|nr:hypothetical protein KUTeg_009901 [Tegillarca granosa]
MLVQSRELCNIVINGPDLCSSFHVMLLAWLCQWLLQKYADVMVKIGRVGFFSCRKVQIIVKKGLSIEIDRAWLSSCFVNQEIKKPLVICIEDIRIQADVRKDCEQPGRTSSSAPPFKNKSGETTLPTFAKYAQYIGLNITNLTVMFLNTMIPDSLVHLKSQNLTVDISLIEQSNSTGDLSFHIRISLKGAGVIYSKTSIITTIYSNFSITECLRVLITKPQAMITEALLTRLQEMRKNPVLSPQEVTEEVQETSEEDVPHFDWNNVPDEIGIDVTELVVKIVREARQRTL